jgi:Arc/MetJ-type ribon-helix-helix transcriptional regulator
MVKLSEDKVPIYVPRQLYEKVKERVKTSEGEFKTVEEYVEFVLQEIVKEEEPEQAYTPEEEEEIKKRLKSLGYL